MDAEVSIEVQGETRHPEPREDAARIVEHPFQFRSGLVHRRMCPARVEIEDDVESGECDSIDSAARG